MAERQAQPEQFELERIDGSTPSGFISRGPFTFPVKDGRVSVPREAVEIFIERGAGWKLSERAEEKLTATANRAARRANAARKAGEEEEAIQAQEEEARAAELVARAARATEPAPEERPDGQKE